jgi:hypothetical protein
MKRAVPKVKKGRKATKTEPLRATRARSRSSTPTIDAKGITDLVETCRAKVEKLLKPAQITYLSVFEYYETEGDDPELWQCCWLVCLLLRQTHAALLTHDTVPQRIFPSECSDIGTKYEAQQRWLRPAPHVIRSVIYVLVDQEADHLEEMIPALRAMERDINELVSALHEVIQHCHQLVGRRRVAR